MKPKRYIYRLLMLVGIAGILGLTFWDVYQVRSAAMSRNQRWVTSMSEMLSAERQMLTRWIERFPLQSSTLRDVANSRKDVSALFLLDLRSQESQKWTRPGMKETLEPLDPRLGALQLEAISKQQTLTGPIVIAGKKPFFTVARPLGKRRVLITFVDASRVWDILRDEASIWHMRASIYDNDKRLLFSSVEPIVPPETLDKAFRKLRAQKGSGIVDLPNRLAWIWLVTAHHDPASDWIFTITQRVSTVYAPAIFFIICMLGVILLVRFPFMMAARARREETAQALYAYSAKVDNYLRGRDVILTDPPSLVREMGPIAATVRWLMPQWKKAEAFPRELALERKLLSLLVESLPEGILFFNAQGGLQLSNELGRVFLALEQEGREPRMVSGVQVPRGFLEPYLEPVFTGQQPNLGKEVEVAWADGKHLYRLWAEHVEAEPGKTGGFIVVVRDITFRKQWEYVQEQVLSGITHDLRGPLSAVLGYIDLMKRQLGDTAAPKVNEYLRMAREAGVRLSQMVTDILDVVRFEQGKIDLVPEPIPVVELFQRLKNTFGVIAEQKKVNLKMAILGESTLQASADRKLLERVLDNLVGNAIKFTPAEGNITITAKADGSRVVFDVVDTGRGIPREAQSRIFDKFQQVRPGDRSAGYGLGLAVSKFIVEAHKGEIRVESEVGMGSRFSFWIPTRPIDSRGDGDPLVNMDPNRIMFPPKSA
jgi:signal transduction histidine kinase